MLNMYSGDQMIVEGPDVPSYLTVSFAFELSFAIGYFFESLTCFIAGHLIVLYSENERATLRKDPITHLEVSSLVFAFNQQQIIDSLAGVRTETYEQSLERLQRLDSEYVRHYIEGYIQQQDILSQKIGESFAQATLSAMEES